MTITQTRCLIPWCKSMHESGDELHYGDDADFRVLANPLHAASSRVDTLTVSLEQVERGGEVVSMVALDTSTGPVYLTRDQARMVAAHLFKLDLDAGDLGGKCFQ